MKKFYKDFLNECELEVENCTFIGTEIDIIYFSTFDEYGNTQETRLSKEDSIDLAMSILNHWFPKGAYINKYKQALMKMSKEDIVKFEEMLEDRNNE